MHHLFVEKKPAHRHDARHLLHDLRESLELNGLKSVRILQRYEVDGIDEATFAQAATTILSEPQLDDLHTHFAPPAGTRAFGVEYLPGQFDQRADSAAQCIQILSGGEKPDVRSSQVIVLEGELTDAEFDAVKRYVINPVDSHEIPVSAITHLRHGYGGQAGRRSTPPPADVATLAGFTTADPATIRSEHGLAMSAEDVAFCQAYFKNEENRDPSITELKMLDTYWSDHCRHTTFLTKIDEVTFDDPAGPVARAWENYQSVRKHLGREEKPVTLMDIALIGMRELRASGELDNLEVSEEVNAASIVVPVSIHNPQSTIHDPERSEEWLVMFKNETHNHPTEIEPFGGAATCLGGCIRDPLSGRSYVYQAMRVTGAGDPTTPFSETLPGKLPQKKICQVAAHGYSSYGNQIGLATGQVAEVYHPGYVAKRMEIGAVVAAAPRANVFRGTPAPGDVILLIGGRTGRDGVGGATGSSKEHDDNALENSAEVQKGDAPTERKIQRLFRNSELTRKIKICNDFGAGGVSVAIGEIAPSLVIDLDAVPKKYDGLDGTELAISESQERMAVCVDPVEIDYFIAEADKENLECVKVADVTDSGRLVMTWRGQTIVNLSRAFLDTNGVQQTANIHVTKGSAGVPPASSTAHCSLLTDHLRSLSVASQRGLGEMFDGSVGAGTVLWPFGGKHQITPPDAMVAKLPLLEGDTDTCTHMAWGFDPYLSEKSPFHGAVYAVTESVCKAVASGARLSDIRLTLQEYFPKLGNDPKRWGLPFAALLGAFHAQHMLRLAAIGGKDSMSGSFNDLDVPPTLVSFALAPGKASLALSPEFKKSGSIVSLVTVPRDADNLPDFTALKQTAEALHQLSREGKLLSLHHIGAPGLAAALAKCCFGNRIGFQQGNAGVPPASSGILPDASKPNGEAALYHEAYFTFLLEHTPVVSDCIRQAVPSLQQIGQTTADPTLILNGESHDLTNLQSAWESTLEPVYPTKPEIEDHGSKIVDAPLHSSSTDHRSLITDHSKPSVVIPAFPGTNSEYDSAKAFREAGAQTEILVFRNLTAKHIEESLEVLSEKIRQSQILMLPGGFSAGDEPDGSAKFIATILRNPRVADAIMDLIKNRDGLILGICNGFQALIKTGLLPYGKIVDRGSEIGDCGWDVHGAASSASSINDPSSIIHNPSAQPTLVHNTLNRHISRYAHTRVTSTLSPWFANSQPRDIHTIPFSHGEGRFYASDEVIAQLAATGQIATQYCDETGTPSMNIAHNPNGSLGAIEGITSPCGRVFGKMGHTERAGTQVAKNIPGEKHQPIFKAGVAYFST